MNHIVVWFCLFILAVSQSVSQYNVVWTTPSQDVSGSMPLGNGRLAANVWVEPQNSKLRLYVSRSDSWDENANLLKLTQVDLVFNPPFDYSSFKQTLNLENATVLVSFNDLYIQTWIDANSNNIVIEAQATKLYKLEVIMNPWRTSQTPNPSGWAQWDCVNRYTYPDVFVQNSPNFPSDSLVFYHRNNPASSTYFQYTLNLQGLTPGQSSIPDPIVNRQFGAAIYGPNLVKTNTTTLSSQPQKQWTVVISSLTSQTSNSDIWEKNLRTQMNAFNLNNLEKIKQLHTNWWKSFWERSYIHINDPSEPNVSFSVSSQYTLWRFLQACDGRSEFVIKFNGLIHVAQVGVAPDYRDWGGANWWQNMRLPYYNMLNAGDFDIMLSLFDYYLNMMPLALVRSQIYWNITGGAYWPETNNIFGASNNNNGYGCPGSRNNFPVSIPESRWNRYNYQGVLDLSLLILDHYTYTSDDNVFSKYIPIIKAGLTFYSQRWTNLDKNGKIIFFPSQAIETYQCITYPPVESDCVTNDLPDIAGLFAVLERVLALPPHYLTPDFKQLCQTLLNKLPPVPTGNNGEYLVAGEKLPSGQSNVENPELYAVHPYRLYTVAKPNLNVAITSYNRRIHVCNEGWCQDIMDAALLGLASDAQKQVIGRAQTAPASGYRFPVFMPHFQDYQPSADHLSNMNNALQWMLLQPTDNSNQDMLLLPAWPCSWDVEFKINGPLNTTVSGSLKGGKLNSLIVNPPSRSSAVKILNCQ